MRTWWDGQTDGAGYIGPFPLRRGGSKNAAMAENLNKPNTFIVNRSAFYTTDTIPS